MEMQIKFQRGKVTHHLEVYNMLLKLFKLITKESLCRARKRVRNNLKQSANTLIYANVFYEGMNGYLRDKIYA